MVERDHAVGDALDDVHVVLDHEDRVAALVAQLADQLGDLVRLDRVHPGGRLVEQQQPRVRSPSPARSRAGAGSRTRASTRAGPSGSPSAAGRRTTSRSSASALDLALLAPHPGRAQDRAHDARLRVPVGGRHHVLLDGHVQEQPQRLERARDAALGDLVRREADDRLALEADVARRPARRRR